MKIYILIYKEDTDDRYETVVSPYSAEDPAIEEMEAAYAEKLQELHFDVSVQNDDHRCFCEKCCARIESGMDYYSWVIEEHDLQDRFVR